MEEAIFDAPTASIVKILYKKPEFTRNQKSLFYAECNVILWTDLTGVHYRLL